MINGVYDEKKLKKLSYTKHARERYAERIMGRDNTRDINAYVAENSDKIDKDIAKLILYGEEIFTGKPSFNNPKQHNCTYVLNDFWVIVIDTQDDKVVTLYRIDLGAGEDIDKVFRDKLLQYINEAKAVAEKTRLEIDGEMATYKKNNQR